MITPIIALQLSLSNPILDKPYKKPVAVQVAPVAPKPLTEQDNPQHCDESHQWIASESPFYCIEKASAGDSRLNSGASSPSGYSNGSTSGNLFDYHSCTWYVASRRYVPNSWGNATDWLWHAQQDGYATGSVPRAGAIGWTYGHVVFIESVAGDQVYLSERNYDYNGSYRERWALATSFTYIY